VNDSFSVWPFVSTGNSAGCRIRVASGALLVEISPAGPGPSDSLVEPFATTVPIQTNSPNKPVRIDNSTAISINPLQAARAF
jgi:hypothetical protein